MKKTILLFLLLQVCFHCNGQGNKISATTYTQKLEYGLKGAVKEVTSYIFKVENGEIPADTTNYAGKTSMIFDRLGNMLVMHRLWTLDTTGNSNRKKTEFKLLFSGKGKDISFKETYRFGDDNLKEESYNYIWSDDYNYTIVSSKESAYTSVITLDKEYRLIKSVFMKDDDAQMTEELEFIYKNDQLQERKNKITEKNRDGEIEVSYQIQVVQETDKYGNPTLIYGYSDVDKQKVTEVVYKAYHYYK